MSDFEKILLTHIRIWTEILTTQQIFTWNWFRIIKLPWTTCFQNFFLSFYIVKMSKLTFSHFLWKLIAESEVFGKKTFFEPKNLRKIGFWINFFTTPQTFKQNNYFLSKFKLNIHKASKLESRFLPRISFRWKNCFQKIKLCWKTRSQGIIYLVNIHQKKVKIGFFAHSWKSCSRKSCFFFFIKGFLDKISWNFSVFESFVVHVIFWIKNFKCVRLRAVFSQPDKFWIEILERVGFRKKVLQRIRFWSEIDL